MGKTRLIARIPDKDGFLRNINKDWYYTLDFRKSIRWEWIWEDLVTKERSAWLETLTFNEPSYED